jgi:hypothetical protein
MADLARLTNLHFLNFNQSDHAMLLASFHNLTRVDVQYPQQSELIELLQSNSNLRHLDLGKLYDFAGMQNISHLTSLSIGLFLNDSTDSAKTLEHAHRLRHLSIWVRPTKVNSATSAHANSTQIAHFNSAIESGCRELDGLGTFEPRRVIH